MIVADLLSHRSIGDRPPTPHCCMIGQELDYAWRLISGSENAHTKFTKVGGG